MKYKIWRTSIWQLLWQ